MSKFWREIKANNIIHKMDKVDALISADASKNKMLIQLNHVWIGFRNWRGIKYILEDIDLKIYENEIVSILGANGVGKTTLVNAISGIIKHQKGTIFLNKEKLSMDEFIGIQFQDLRFPQSLSVKNMLNFQMDLLDHPISSKLLVKMLQTFQLNACLNKVVSKMSGGQQQRLNVLLALISKPRVLFLDEFTTGLDIASKKAITDFIFDFAKTYKIAVVLISHDIDTIRTLTERFVVLINKKIIVNSPRKDVLNKFETIDNFLAYYIK